jgi:adenosylcobyric acid synthase
MHIGRTIGPDCSRSWITLADGSRHGAASESGRVLGAYLHGLFASDAFRAAFLRDIGAASDLSYDAQVERVLDDLAQHLERHLDIDALLEMARTPSL